MRVISTATLIGLALMSGWSLAESAATETTLDNPRYFFVNGRYIDTDNNRGVRDGSGVHAGFSIPLNSNWGLELAGFNQTLETGSAGGTDFYQRGGGLDLVYSLGNRSGFTPFVLAGLGAAQNDVTPDSKDKVTAYGNLGIGLVGGLFATDWLRGRLEGRVVYDDFESGQLDFIVGAGLELAVGVTRERVVTHEVEKTVYVDKPVERIVEVPVEKVVYQPVEKVVEKIVIQEVAPPDSDGDNIRDAKDLCPGTLPGLVTDNRGCVITRQIVRLDNVLFEFGSDVLTQQSSPVLDEAADFLRQQPDLHVEVAGHTDSRGSDAFNMRLSKLRATRVLNGLAERKIGRERMMAHGYGEALPVADNVSDSGRALNRRVELRIK